MRKVHDQGCPASPLGGEATSCLQLLSPTCSCAIFHHECRREYAYLVIAEPAPSALCAAPPNASATARNHANLSEPHHQSIEARLSGRRPGLAPVFLPIGLMNLLVADVSCALVLVSKNMFVHQGHQLANQRWPSFGAHSSKSGHGPVELPPVGRTAPASVNSLSTCERDKTTSDSMCFAHPLHQKSGISMTSRFLDAEAEK